VATLAELYGEALARVVEIVAEPAVLAALTADELVGHLLLLHGLHPEPVADRVARAAAEASAELGGAVEVVSVSDGVARLRVAAPGCPSSAPATLDAISNVVVAAAPELIAVQPEPVRPPRPAALIPAESLLRHPAGR
jgi:hypothetical protein